MQAGIRQQLADGTACPHQILHGHADIGRLNSTNLELSAYQQILRFFLTFYQSAEIQRASIGVWPQFTLEPAIAALQHDTGYCDSLDEIDMSWINGPASCIGMLYVLHGASIGGKIIAKNISAILPGAPLQFFSRGLAPGLWQGLIDALESYHGNTEEFAHILHSATKTFQGFDCKIVSES